MADALIRIADFDVFGTLVHIGDNVHHFPPKSWNRCFPRPARPLAVPPEETPMTTTADETKTPTKTDDTKPASKAVQAAPPKNYKERLPCKLTDKEKLGIGDLIVLAEDEVSRLEDEKKSAADSFKAKIELAQA